MTNTTTRAPRKTAEEKKAQAEALHASITDQVDALRNTDQWKRFLGFAQSFHAYSLNNLLLILSQRPDATTVAGFRAWQAKGRQVRKGETGIRIFGYRQQKLIEEDENGDDIEKTITRYPILTVFDIEQTDPIEGADDISTLSSPLTGTDDFGIVDTLSNHLTANGWKIEYQSLPGGQSGYTAPETHLIVIDDQLSAEHTAKTMIHETAHIVLRHIDDMTEHAQHRGLMETEAESVAYIVAGMLGIDTSSYSIGYIAGWSNANTDLIKSTAGRVLKTAHTIAEILTSDNDEGQHLDA
ncbi:ArdC-like ssDNA-binding domain-containing protein [Leifsonia sp. Root112D2]|uniref:ArdC-like ssDNA-binding domain-containing protein n=1 Tax=Leifsonia sp. Root112D2 TaxID=1736426 RepID=UPI0006F3D783|nr:ArdC-like ssDNA-binding domain-containing protein [Leifsonia sp. Root112D2]KQV07087.1 hypothetical protein ASC63_07085 [Leifsonia sp. Root112D2]